MPFAVLSLTSLACVTYALLACALTATGIAVALLAPLARPSLGRRGLQRQRALAARSFRALEPTMRWVAAVLQPVCPDPLRARAERALVRAGDYLGLSAEELLAASALSGLGGFACCSLLGGPLASTLGLLATPLACAALPFLALAEHRRMRVRVITRRLPAALDLLSLAMNAGLDFAAGIEIVTRELGTANDPLTEELHVLLHELSLGHPRKRALAALAERAGTPALAELTAAVIQGEQKGTPLASILETQAQVSRNRRSVSAEEAAARAAVLLMLPLVLLLGAVLLVLFGPFLIGGFAL